VFGWGSQGGMARGKKIGGGQRRERRMSQKRGTLTKKENSRTGEKKKELLDRKPSKRPTPLTGATTRRQARGGTAKTVHPERADKTTSKKRTAGRGRRWSVGGDRKGKTKRKRTAVKRKEKKNPVGNQNGTKAGVRRQQPVRPDQAPSPVRDGGR